MQPPEPERLNVIKQRLANGMTIADEDVHDLVSIVEAADRMREAANRAANQELAHDMTHCDLFDSMNKTAETKCTCGQWEASKQLDDAIEAYDAVHSGKQGRDAANAWKPLCRNRGIRPWL